MEVSLVTRPKAWAVDEDFRREHTEGCTEASKVQLQFHEDLAESQTLQQWLAEAFPPEERPRFSRSCSLISGHSSLEMPEAGAINADGEPPMSHRKKTTSVSMQAALSEQRCSKSTQVGFRVGWHKLYWTNFTRGIMPVERSVQVKRTWRHGSLQLRQLWD